MAHFQTWECSDCGHSWEIEGWMDGDRFVADEDIPVHCPLCDSASISDYEIEEY